ncbi:MAG: hypothetical protein EXQ56_03460 [Acidobacteria bacterium]|nr:hypothetical protein [Acidobacteriota bacterium]
MILLRSLMRKAFGLLSEQSRWSGPIVLALLTLIFYSRILFTNRAIIPWDAVDFFYPLLGYVHEELRHFRLPLWTPFNFAGYPVIADPEAQIFYPPNWLMLVSRLFYPLSYKLLEIQIVVHYFLAGLSMYWLVKDWTKKHLPALIAGVIYMFSGPLTTHAQHQSIVNALGWFPLVFLLARRALHGRDWRAGALAGGAYGMVCLTGHYQHAVYLGLLLFLYFFYEACAGADRKILWPHWILLLGTIALIGAGLAMVQLIPAAELGALSIRSQLTPEVMAGGRDPRYLWTYFLPNFFGEFHGAQLRLIPWPSYQIAFISVPGCVLALVGLVEMARRKNFFWLGMIIVFSLASLGTNGPFFKLNYSLPLLKLFRNIFIFVNLAIFSAAVMAGVGAAALEDEEKRRFHLRWLRVFVLAAFAFAVLGGLHWGWLGIIPYYWYMLLGLGIVSAFVLAWPMELRRIHAVQWTILLLAAAELFNFHMNNPFNAEPRDPRLFMSYDSLYDRKEEIAFLRADQSGDFRVANTMGWPNNYWNLVRIPGTYGWNPVLPRRYNEYVRQFMQTNAYAWADAGPDNNLQSGMQDLLGIKYYLTVSIREADMHMEKMANLKKVYDGLGWYKIYENRNFLSRAWMFDRAYVVPDNAAALALMNSLWFTARSALVMERGDVPANPAFPIEELQTYTLPSAEEGSTGGVIDDGSCSEPRRYRAYWGNFPDDWQRFPLPANVQPGNYLISAEYFTQQTDPFPIVTAKVQQDDQLQEGQPTKVPRSGGYFCASTRTVDLGVFELRAGAGSITLTAHQKSDMSIYGLTLIRLPKTPSPEGTATPAMTGSDFKFRDYDVSANRYSFTVASAKPRIVLVNEIFYPGLEATIDGQPAEVLRADSIFRALPVSAGSHRIEMRFRPRHFWIGASVSLLTLCGLIVFWRMGRRSSGSRSQEANAAVGKAGSPLRSE